MTEEREREYVGVGVCGCGRRERNAEKLGKRVCGCVGMWVWEGKRNAEKLKAENGKLKGKCT
jgi:hypothetical protein